MKVSGGALRKQRLQLVGLATLFVAPLLISWIYLQFQDGERILTTTNKGELIYPARSLVEFSLPGINPDSGISIVDLNNKWTYVVFAPRGCTETCREDIYHTRQLRTSMNKDMERIQLLLVLSSPPDAGLVEFLAKEHPFLIVTIDSPEIGFARQFAVDQYTADGSHIFLLDPLANLMMAYARDTPWKGMFKDLKKLLKASQIG